MNIMGIGPMELAVILLVAFLVLGPGKTIDMAKRTGKVLGDLRRAFTDVTDAIAAEENQRTRPTPPNPTPDTTPPGIPSRPDLPDDTDAENPPPNPNPPNNDTPPTHEKGRN